MSEERNKNIALNWFNAQSSADLDIAKMDELTAPNFVYHNISNPQVQTHEERKQKVVMALANAFTDIKTTIQDVIAEGDKVVLRYLMIGTQKAEFMGIPPTNRRINLTSICILRLANGKVAEMWVENNSMVLMQQLGIIPLQAGNLYVKE